MVEKEQHQEEKTAFELKTLEFKKEIDELKESKRQVLDKFVEANSKVKALEKSTNLGKK